MENGIAPSGKNGVTRWVFQNAVSITTQTLIILSSYFLPDWILWVYIYIYIYIYIHTRYDVATSGTPRCCSAPAHMMQGSSVTYSRHLIHPVSL